MDLNWASHLVDEFFANAETQTSSGRVDLLVFAQPAEIYEKFTQIFLFNAYSCVFYDYLKFDIVFAWLCLVFLYFQQLSSHGDFTAIGSELYCVR